MTMNTKVSPAPRIPYRPARRAPDVSPRTVRVVLPANAERAKARTGEPPEGSGLPVGRIPPPITVPPDKRSGPDVPVRIPYSPANNGVAFRERLPYPPTNPPLAGLPSRPRRAAVFGSLGGKHPAKREKDTRSSRPVPIGSGPVKEPRKRYRTLWQALPYYPARNTVPAGKPYRTPRQALPYPPANNGVPSGKRVVVFSCKTWLMGSHRPLAHCSCFLFNVFMLLGEKGIGR